MSKGWWSTVAAISLALNTILVFGLVYVAWAYGSNLDAIQQSQNICFVGREGFDSIAAAQMIGRLDHVTFVLTMGGLLLALFAFIGFWMIRREVIDQAAVIAADEARSVAQEYYAREDKVREQKGDKPDKLSYLIDGVRNLFRRKPVGKFDPTEVSTAGAKEQLGDSDDKPE